MSPLLLDTHTAIWVSRGELSASAAEKLHEAARTGVTTYVSPITAWEVGLLVSHNRLSLGATPQRWFARILATPNVYLAELSPSSRQSVALQGGPMSQVETAFFEANAHFSDAVQLRRWNTFGRFYEIVCWRKSWDRANI